MKIKTTILAVAAAVILSGCASIKTDPEHDRETISWNAFCSARGYARNDNSSPTINEYLDTWRGTTEEENAWLKAGIEP